MDNIPIRNLYYLFLYAWDRFPEGKQMEVGMDASPDLPNLLARVLIFGALNLFRRGLDRGYHDIIEDLNIPRGRFLLGETMRHNGLKTGRIVCAYDELTTDVPHNRILKATFERLALSPEIDPGHRASLKGLQRQLPDVANLYLSRDLFRPLQLTRNNGHYGLLMKVCEMVMEICMPDEAGNGSRFLPILEDEHRMSTIFEVFVRNFFRHEQREFKVSSEVISWDTLCIEPIQARYLPAMVTDVTLRSPDRTIVIDAKFYKQTLISYMGGHPKVRSAHLYQLLTYLRNLKGHAEGVLLYPSVDGSDLRLAFDLAGHLIRVWSIDMARPWQEIHCELLRLLEPTTTGPAAPFVQEGL